MTVQLRVEGATSTIFEGPVTTDGKAIDKGSGPHPCDGTNGGASPSPVPTATSALDDGSLAAGFTWAGDWTPSLEDFLVNRIGPDASDASRFWGIALNFKSLSVGGCHQRVQPADEVLFGYDFFSKQHLLKLTGAGTASVGQPLALTVTDGQDGSPIAGAAIAGASGAVSAADGSASAVFDSPGLKVLKAERADSIRSNALVVCVPEPGRSDCGQAAPPGVAGQPPIAGLVAPAGAGGPRGPVRDSKAPGVRISGPRHARTYRSGPRLLKGTASDSESGVSEVKLALRRHVDGSNCRWWSGRRERFVGNHCRKPFFFAVGDDAEWSYLLPRRLPPGHYVLDVKAFDRAGNGDEQFERGTSRAVFDVLGRSGRLVGPPGLRHAVGSSMSGRHRKRESAAASARSRGARVQVMVVGRTQVLVDPATVRARQRRVRVSARNCVVGASTPLAALAESLRRVRVSYHVRDFGRCSLRSALDSGQLFVDRIGSDRNRGQDGWFYKVNHRAPTSGAADPAGLPGRRLRSGDRVLWFYCAFETGAGSCQQSLEVIPSTRVARAGGTLQVRVVGYRNEGGSRPVPGATVTLGPSSGTTDADGRVVLSLASAGVHRLHAVKPATVPSFPVTVRVL